MTETAPISSADRGIKRKAVIRALSAAAVIGLGIVAVKGLEAALNATFNKPPAPLRKPLFEISRSLGEARYRGSQTDLNMSPEEIETLGTRDYVIREYQDTRPEGRDTPRWVNLNLNYYPTGSSSPHVPEICWTGSGQTEVGGSREFFDVKGVPRADGSTADIRMRLVSFRPQGGEVKSASGEPMYCYVAYTFHVNGNYVASPQEVTSQFWKAAYKYAYHCKIEITPLVAELPPGHKRRGVAACTKDEAIKVISDFLRVSLPEIEGCLPDPASLTDSGQANPSKTREQR